MTNYNELASKTGFVFLYSRGTVQSRGFQFFFNKAKEYLFQMRFKMEVSCAKLMNKTQAVLVEKR